MGKDSFSLATLDSSHNSPQKNTLSFFGDPDREPRGNSKFKQGRNGLMPYLAEMQDRKKKIRRSFYGKIR